MMFNRARETRDASGRFFRAETVGNQPLPRPENPAQPACKQSITHSLLTVAAPAPGDGDGGDGSGGDGGDGGTGGGTGGPGTQTGAPTAPSVPVATDALDPALKGAIVAPAAVRIGDPFTVQVGTAHAGAWVQLWLHSQPTALGGWTQVSAAGVVTGIVPAGFNPGQHTLVAQTATGVLGWTTLSVETAPQQAHISALSQTGYAGGWGSLAATTALLAMLLGAGLLVTRRMRRG